MLRRRGIIRWAAALTLAVALARPAVASPLETAGESLVRFWDEARSWIAAVLPWAVAGATSDHGPMIDPNGATSGSDHGPYIDPNG